MSKKKHTFAAEYILKKMTNKKEIKLPIILSAKLADESKAAFEKAVEEGYIINKEGEEGKLTWQLSKTLLVYFCGRLFAGDYLQYSRRQEKYLWMKGKGKFPAIPLGDTFGEKTLKQLRKKRLSLPSPNDHEIIDGLFS